jgi:MFS family permease
MMAGGARLGRRFWLLWWAATASQAGDGLRVTAFPLLAAILSRDAMAVSMVTAASWAPWLCFGLWVGAIVDRSHLRTVLWWVQVVRALCLAGFAAGVAAGVAAVPLLAVTAFVVGTGEVFGDAAGQAMLPSLVPAGDLVTANGRLAAAEFVAAELVGPPVGALLFALAPALPFAIDATSFAVSAGFVRQLPVDAPAAARPVGDPVSLWSDAKEGLRWLAGHHLLRLLAVAAALANAAYTAFVAVLVLYAFEVLHLAGTGYGLLLAALAVGGLGGSMGSGRVVARIGPRAALLAALLLSALAAAGLGVVSHIAPAAGLLGILGAAAGLTNVVIRSLRQRLVPAGLLGRVTAAFRMVGYGAVPLGAAGGGLVARHFGLRAPFLAAGVTIALLAAAVARATAGSIFEPVREAEGVGSA